MTPRIALPEPTGADLNYNRLNTPAYADALRQAGAEPVVFRLDMSPADTAELANSCQGVLLPGSPADVNSGKYGESRDGAAAPPDLARENVDELLLQDAHNLHKPILGICFGTQILNVWRCGTLVQDLGVLPVNHAASRSVSVAHTVAVTPGSLLASIVDTEEAPLVDGLYRLPVNSSHHQAILVSGDGLMVSARCPQDDVAEAVEATQLSATHVGEPGEARLQPVHFVLGVQWHPERTLTQSSTSRRLFARLVAEAGTWRPRAVLTSVLRQS